MDFSMSKSPVLMINKQKVFPEAYVAPCVRVVVMSADISFLASNLEPIDGGDDPFIDW